jgi:hypothetical protein
MNVCMEGGAQGPYLKDEVLGNYGFNWWLLGQRFCL